MKLYTLILLFASTAYAQEVTTPTPPKITKDIFCISWDSGPVLQSHKFSLSNDKVIFDSKDLTATSLYDKEEELFIMPVTFYKTDSMKKECFVYMIKDAPGCTQSKKILSLSRLKFDEAKKEYLDNDEGFAIGDCAENHNLEKFQKQQMVPLKELSDGFLIKK
jgi:hypothetical protein